MSEQKTQPSVLDVLPEATAKRRALSESQVIEALRVGREERIKAQTRVPHTTASSRHRFR